MAEPKYVLGFLFNHDLSKVVLIQKTKPAWQNGLFNGVGGKVEPGEIADQAMIREFQEETGVMTEIAWRQFANFYSGKCDPAAPNAVIACYTAMTEDASLFYSVKTTTEEMIAILDSKEMYNYTTVPNLRWLVPLAMDYYRDDGVKFAELFF